MNLMMNTTSTAGATPGTMQADALNLFTIERPWNNNAPDTSCVPPGTYALIPYLSPEHGDTYCLHNATLNVYGPAEVTGIVIPENARTVCELHSANWARQLKGCIATGLEGQPMFDPVTDLVSPAVEHSVDAIKELLGVLGVGVYGHILTIVRN